LDILENTCRTSIVLKSGGRPLYGAQQIVGEDSNLRVAEVSFPQDHYARIDTIKASSALSAAGKILDKILEQEPSQAKAPKQSPQPLIEAVPKSKIDSIAKKIAAARASPLAWLL
jgi:predicted transcriptional regulator